MSTSKFYFSNWIFLRGFCLFLILTFSIKLSSQSLSDSTQNKKYVPSKRPTYKPKDRYGDAYMDKQGKSPFYDIKLKNSKTDVEIDESGKFYRVNEKMNGTDVRNPSEMTYEQYKAYQKKQTIKNFYSQKSKEKEEKGPETAKSRSLVPRIYMNPSLDRIFGGNYIDVKLNGSVLIDFGYRISSVDNPATPVNLRTIGQFIFDQNIAMNAQGKIGEKLKLTINQDTKSQFDFDNTIKIEYTSTETEIIQKIEAGNVSLPLNNSLITGAQNLFGLKATLKFGRLTAIAVAAQQRGRADEIKVDGGAQVRKFEIRASEYQDNQHYFLAHFFRDKYEEALATMPFVNSGVMITRVEVWVTNRDNTTQGLRNIAALMDLGENKFYNKADIFPAFDNLPVARNNANSLSRLINDNNILSRNADNLNNLLSGQGFENGNDFELVRNAKLLDPSRYRFHPQLGYISLNSPLSRDDVMAVAFEYSYRGVTYRVGEFSGDNGLQTNEQNSALYVKLLRPSTIRTDVPMWDLQMKNIYSIGSTQISKENFQFRITYRDDKTQLNNPVLKFGGTPEIENFKGINVGGIDGKPLIQVMKLDQLNMSNDPQPDGNFDFVESVANQTSLAPVPTPGTQPSLSNTGTPGTAGATTDPTNPNNAAQSNAINNQSTNKMTSVTIDPGFGRVIFPVLEPFGRTLRQGLGNDTLRQPELVGKYVYDEIYRKTKSDVLQIAGKNKYFLVGQLQSSSSDVIQFASFGGNIDPKFVNVFSGSNRLTENQDYILQADLGQVKIINPTYLMSGQQVRVTYDKSDLFQVRQRAFWGTRLDYKVSKDIAFGGTFLNLSERPMITRVSIGDEPVSNSIIGLDGTYKRESGFITKMLDKLPVYNTKEKSTIQAQGEFAKLFTGSPELVNKGGKPNYFIDDFEFSQQPTNLGASPQTNWRVSSAPKDLQGDNYNPLTNKLAVYDNRARLAWYTIDNSFYRGGGNVPDNITSEDKKNHYIRAVSPQALYPGRQATQIPINEQTFDMAYFPHEKGQYNYNADVDNNGLLKNPRRSWGGITRAINNQDTDFDNINYQYLEFWMMDPFEKDANGKVLDGRFNANNNTGGQLQFHLGSVSEDVIKDGRQNFEQGLPVPNVPLNTPTPDADVTDFGRATNQQYLTNSFSTQPGAREAQDIGLDGIDNSQEREKFQTYLNQLPPEARNQAQNDPSNDDFKHYLNETYNEKNAKILERYKLFNGMENNSQNNTGASFNASNYTSADNEDLNLNQTLNETEEYFKYTINIKPGELKVGSNFIINEVNEFYDDNGDGEISDADGGKAVKWYQFRIPLREGFERIGNIKNFKSMRFMRTILTDWQQPVVLRMSQLQLVASSWRQYTDDLSTNDLKEVIEPNDKVFTISEVNIEENLIGSEKNSPYTLPPNFQRDRDLSTTITRELNEHSLRLCVDNLAENDARGAFKVYSTGSTGLNLLNYDRIKMFVHAESPDYRTIKPGDATIFMRLGTDLNENYYEVEIPLDFTDNSKFVGQNGQTLTLEQKFEIWKKDNWFDFKLEELSDKKLLRDTTKSTDRFQRFFAGTLKDSTGLNTTNQKLYIRGNPTYSNIQAIMIGIRNPKGGSDKLPKSLCVWANELRLSGFLNSDGWAATGRVNIKLADLGNVSATTKYATAGFGGLEQKISQRLQETTHDYGATGNIAVDKLLPFNEKVIGLKLPLYVSIDKKTITPKYDPLRPDVKTDKSLDYRPDSVRSEYAKLIEDQTLRRSISLTNIQKVKVKPGAKKHIYDIENLSATLAYNDINRSNVNIQGYNQKNYKAGIGYNYGLKSSNIQPLKNVNGPFKSDYLKLIKEINFSLLPSNITFRGDLDRTITRTQMSNGIETGEHDILGIRPTYEKRFLFNRTYALMWNFTKSISFNYSATANALVDEPRGEINNDTIRAGFTKRDSVMYNLTRGGRTKTFIQNVRINYRLPLDKFPLTSFLSADASYNAGYNWNAGAVGISDSLGNTAQNNRDLTLNARADLQKIYSKIPFLAKMNQASAPPPPPPLPTDTSKKKLPPPPPQLKGLKFVMRLLMMVKSVNATYQQTEGTVLPGYKGRPRILGMDDKKNNGSLYTEFIPFIVGSQDDNIYKEVDFASKYMSRGQLLSNFVTQNKSINITGRATIEPFKEFRIQLDAKVTNAFSYQELYKYNADQSSRARNEGLRDSVIFESLAPTRSGSYSISYLSIGTFFVRDNPDNTNETFSEFERNRDIFRERLSEENPIKSYSYTINSQEVLIPSFLAAYAGKDPKKSSVSAFPRIPLPNWRLDYAGLPTLFPGIKKIFPTISITHAYTSTYNVANYVSNGLYYGPETIKKSSPLEYQYASVADSNGFFRPINNISSVSIVERFAPLLGVNLKTKNNMNFRAEYKTDRNVMLSISNNQITDNRNEEFVFGFGYTKGNMKLPFLYRGREIVIKNDVQFRVDISRRESGIVQRKIDGKPLLTQGLITYQVTPNIGYQLNQRLNIQIYCEYRLNQPKQTNLFKSSSFQFGVRFRFSLS